MEEIFNYGDIKVKLAPLLQNIQNNIDLYSDLRDYDEELKNLFIERLNYISEGLKNGTITSDGSGRFYDTAKGLSNLNNFDRDSLNYINTIINKLYELNKNIGKVEEKPEELEKFDINNNGLLKYILTSLFPNKAYEDMDFGTYRKSLVTIDENNNIDTSGLYKNFGKLIGNYLADTDYTKYDFSLYKTTSEEYINNLKALQEALQDGELSASDKMLLYKIGVDNELISNMLPTKLIFTKDDSNSKESGSNKKDNEEPVKLDLDKTKSSPKLETILEDNSFDWDDAVFFGSIAADIAALYTKGTWSAGAGLMADALATAADAKEVGIGKALINRAPDALYSILGAVPLIRNKYSKKTILANKIAQSAGTLWKYFEAAVAGSAVGELSRIIDPQRYQEIVHSFSKVGKDGDENELTINDYKNFAEAIKIALKNINLMRRFRIGNNLKKIKEDSLEESVILNVKLNGKKKKLAFVDADEIKYIKEHSKNPELIKEHIKNNYPSYGDIELELTNDKKSLVKAVISSVKHPTKIISNTKDAFKNHKLTSIDSKRSAYNMDVYDTEVANLKGRIIKKDAKTVRKNMNKNITRVSNKTTPKNIAELKVQLNRLNIDKTKKTSIENSLEAFQTRNKTTTNKADRALKVFDKTSTPSADYELVLKDLKSSNISEDEARQILLNLEIFKDGGILKAQNGDKITEKPIDLSKYKGYDTYFELYAPEGTGEWHLKTDYTWDNPELLLWLKSNGILYGTEEVRTYGDDKYTYNAPPATMYNEGAKSLGLVGANRNLRSLNLGHKDSVFNEEVDLNAHVLDSRMYQNDPDNKLRMSDFVNWATNNYQPGMTLELLLSKYNMEVDSDYAFKRTDNALKYDTTGNEEVRAFNRRNRGRYYSLNSEGGIHGYDEASEHINGSETMSRSVDITDNDITGLDFSNSFGDNKELASLFANRKLGKTKSGHYFTTDNNITLTAGESSYADKSEDPKDTLAVKTGVPIKNNTLRVEPSIIFSGINYLRSLLHNKKLAEFKPDMSLYDPSQFYRTVLGDFNLLYDAIKGMGQANSTADNTKIADVDKLMSFKKDMFGKGLEYLDAKKAQYDASVKESAEKAVLQEIKNLENRTAVKYKNIDNMTALNNELLLSKAARLRADYESGTNFINDLNKYYLIRANKREAFENYYFSKNLKNSIANNPQNYINGWTRDHSRIWELGMRDLTKLTKEEQVTYSELKALAQLAYDLKMAEKYDINFDSPSAESLKRRLSNWSIQADKKGGKLGYYTYLIKFLQERNKMYQADMSRASKGMHNYTKNLNWK